MQVGEHRIGGAEARKCCNKKQGTTFVVPCRNRSDLIYFSRSIFCVELKAPAFMT